MALSNSSISSGILGIKQIHCQGVTVFPENILKHPELFATYKKMTRFNNFHTINAIISNWLIEHRIIRIRVKSFPDIGEHDFVASDDNIHLYLALGYFLIHICDDSPNEFICPIRVLKNNSTYFEAIFTRVSKKCVVCKLDVANSFEFILVTI